MKTIEFEEVRESSGVNGTYFSGNMGCKHLVESMVGGIAVVDIDSDGQPDWYLPQGCSLRLNFDRR